MTQIEQTQHAKEFAEYWKDKGDEKQETQRYWIELLQEVLGIENPSRYIEFEKRVKLTHTSFIDAYISSTKVLIEQKGAKVDLTKPQEQSDGAMLTPYQQAKRYADELSYDLKPRWIVVSNFKEIHIHDMNNLHAEPEIILLENLEKEYYRLQFLVDTKNENIRREEEISLQAGILVGKLYDALIKEYINPDESSLRSLNILCVRLVFCFYAEDAGLFETRTSFEDYIKSFNLPNLRKAMIDLFKGLDTKLENRDKYDTSLKPFPYVNGGLFAAEDIEIPNFTQEIVDVLVNDCAPFDWSEISPTIFGAVFESTLNPETRRTGGMHYTSIENIHKVIDPLFMDELEAEFGSICTTTNAKSKNDKLHAFQEKLGTLKFLDPACGSGNFLTETYLSLRKLENKILGQLLKGGQKLIGFTDNWSPIEVSINQFYGIEINDFAVTVAKTALWIAESQMIQETEKILEKQLNFLPLKSYANIVEGNALRMDWATLKPIDENVQLNDGLFAGFATEVDGNEIKYDYIMGNPPFVGARLMNEEQKDDVISVWGNIKNIGNVDYVSCWYKKSADMMKDTNIRTALVSTNSITQGEQVAIMWKPLMEMGVKIDFAYRTFRWDSESTQKAHVHCVIVGFSCDNETHKEKRIFNSDGTEIVAKNINGYLVNADDIFIESRTKPLCDVPEIGIGNKPIDGGNYLFTEEEMKDFIKKEPLSEKYFKKWIGADEFINGYYRYCLWLGDCSQSELLKMPECLKRVKAVRELRLASKSEGTRKIAEKPTRFHVENFPTDNYIVIPEISSEKRNYIPIGFVPQDVMSSNRVKISENATLYNFGVLTSNIHMAWTRAVCGRLKSDYCYSVNVVYNNFPWCNPTDEQKAKIEKTAQAILDARAKYPDCSLAQLYGENAFLFPELVKAHQANDRAVMEAYHFDKLSDHASITLSNHKFDITESEIVAELFKMYEKLVEGK